MLYTGKSLFSLQNASFLPIKEVGCRMDNVFRVSNKLYSVQELPEKTRKGFPEFSEVKIYEQEWAVDIHF